MDTTRCDSAFMPEVLLQIIASKKQIEAKYSQSKEAVVRFQHAGLDERLLCCTL